MTPQSLVAQPPQREKLVELFTRIESKSWLREFSGGAAAAPASEVAAPASVDSGSLFAPDRSAYETVLDWPAFERWLEKINAAALTAVDTETTSLDPFAARIVGISLATAPGEACYIPVDHHYAGVPAQLPRDEVLAKLCRGSNRHSTPSSAST